VQHAAKTSQRKQLSAARAAHDITGALASPGAQLEPQLRKRMESRFTQDFSQVRVHTGEAAIRSARALGAAAYTV
jgi:HPt (histidine-containing phosphotransfer) domain-containing protein